MLPTRSVLARLLLSAALVASVGCKENGYDYLDEGLRILGEAERSDCKLGFDASKGQNTINTTRVGTCLDTTRRALEKFHKARELGVDTGELNELIAKTEREVEKLESMMRMVAKMENERGLD